MAAARSNRLLPLLGGIVLLMLAFVAVKSCSEKEKDSVVLERVPEAPAPDADTPADTIKTLTANVAAMTAELDALRRDNASLRKENEALLASRAAIEENVATRVKRELLSREHDQENRARIDSGVLSSLMARVDALAESVSEVRSSTVAASDIPVGLGLEEVTGGADADTILWVEPLDGLPPGEPEGEGASGGPQGLRGYLAPFESDSGLAQDEAARLTGSAGSGLEEPKPRPVYTVPRNATLIGSTAMTALVGRVPVQGQVRDPMPFKIITGRDNLAANGLSVPGVASMVWSGTAIGDWTLSCVTGRLTSVTFVFDDGTIRTLSSDDRGGGGGSAGGAAADGLGWISDAQGIPCVSGERKTNAPAFLAKRIGVMAVQAAAQAAAAAETTTVISESGAARGSVTGDVGRYVLGQTIAGGSDEVARWLLEREGQSFDAVFVPAGAEVAIHVDRELAIDFDESGRRLSHARPSQSRRHARLD